MLMHVYVHIPHLTLCYSHRHILYHCNCCQISKKEVDNPFSDFHGVNPPQIQLLISPWDPNAIPTKPLDCKLRLEGITDETTINFKVPPSSFQVPGSPTTEGQIYITIVNSAISPQRETLLCKRKATYTVAFTFYIYRCLCYFTCSFFMYWNRKGDCSCPKQRLKLIALICDGQQVSRLVATQLSAVVTPISTVLLLSLVLHFQPKMKILTNFEHSTQPDT